METGESVVVLVLTVIGRGGKERPVVPVLRRYRGGRVRGRGLQRMSYEGVPVVPAGGKYERDQKSNARMMRRDRRSATRNTMSELSAAASVQC